MEKINKEAQAVIDRIERCAESYGTVFDIEKITAAMQKHYDALGVPMPKIVAIDNWEEAFSAARGASRVTQAAANEAATAWRSRRRDMPRTLSRPATGLTAEDCRWMKSFRENMGTQPFVKRTSRALIRHPPYRRTAPGCLSR